MRIEPKTYRLLAILFLIGAPVQLLLGHVWDAFFPLGIAALLWWTARKVERRDSAKQTPGTEPPR